MAAEEQKLAQDASIEDVLSSIKQIVEQESGTKTPGVPQPFVATPLPEVVSEKAPESVLELSETEIMGEQAPVDNKHVAEPEVVDIDAFIQTGDNVATKTPSETATDVAATPKTASTKNSLPSLPGGQVHLTAMAGAKGLQVGFPVEVLAEALRPLIKDWVDSNLPDIVERLVKEELAKLADK